MLYLMRKVDESIIINNNIELKVVDIKGKSVKLGFKFPSSASVLRKELYEKIMDENKAAAEADPNNVEDFADAIAQIGSKNKKVGNGGTVEEDE